MIARHLITRKLAACANIMAPHKAVYEWQGHTESGAETAMILKSRENLFEQVKDEICAHHSYDCPCIISWPVISGHEPFLQWIEDQTAV